MTSRIVLALAGLLASSTAFASPTPPPAGGPAAVPAVAPVPTAVAEVAPVVRLADWDHGGWHHRGPVDRGYYYGGPGYWRGGPGDYRAPAPVYVTPPAWGWRHHSRWVPGRWIWNGGWVWLPAHWERW